MEKGHIAGYSPVAVDVKVGQEYYWCACGRSSNQPFCDGGHEGTTFLPMLFITEKDETKYFCTCKQTNTPPFCDGTHDKLER